MLEKGQVLEVKEKIGQIPKGKWIVIRSNGGVYALALYKRKDYRPIGCLSEVELQLGITEGAISPIKMDTYQMAKPKGIKKK